MKEFIDKLIGRLEEYQDKLDTDMWASESNNWYGQFCNGTSEGIDDAISIINELAEEFAADINVVSNNGWIPCSENTPDNRNPVLVCATGKDEGVFISYYIEEEDRWRYDTDDGGHYYVDVIAWQPLPSPFKEGI